MTHDVPAHIHEADPNREDKVTVISTWTDERIAELKRLHAEGFSCSQIAFRLGEVTRNSVVGKVFRLGLVKGDKMRPVAPKAPRERKSTANTGHHHAVTRIVRSNGNSNSMRAIRSVETEQYKLRCVEIECTTAWADVTGCWYPTGDGPYLFCNGPRQDGSSYCIHHFNLTTQEPRAQRIAA